MGIVLSDKTKSRRQDVEPCTATRLFNTRATIRQFICAVDLHVTVLQALDQVPRIRLESSTEPHINRNTSFDTTVSVCTSSASSGNSLRILHVDGLEEGWKQ
jgi:hypothetical protein